MCREQYQLCKMQIKDKVCCLILFTCRHHNEGNLCQSNIYVQIENLWRLFLNFRTDVLSAAFVQHALHLGLVAHFGKKWMLFKFSQNFKPSLVSEKNICWRGSPKCKRKQDDKKHSKTTLIIVAIFAFWTERLQEHGKMQNIELCLLYSFLDRHFPIYT